MLSLKDLLNQLDEKVPIRAVFEYLKEIPDEQPLTFAYFHNMITGKQSPSLLVIISVYKYYQGNKKVDDKTHELFMTFISETNWFNTVPKFLRPQIKQLINDFLKEA